MGQMWHHGRQYSLDRVRSPDAGVVIVLSDDRVEIPEAIADAPLPSDPPQEVVGAQLLKAMGGNGPDHGLEALPLVVLLFSGHHGL